jgi:hypothetical protein
MFAILINLFLKFPKRIHIPMSYYFPSACQQFTIISNIRKSEVWQCGRWRKTAFVGWSGRMQASNRRVLLGRSWKGISWEL